MTAPNLDITRKGRYIVVDPDTGLVSQHNTEIEGVQQAANHSAGHGGKVVRMDPPVYEVKWGGVGTVQPIPDAGEPAEPDPIPDTDPLQESSYKLPPMPRATNVIRLEAGKHDIKDRIKGGAGQVNHIIGPRSATVYDLGYIGKASFIFEGVTLECRGNYKKATFIEGSRGIDSQCWLIDCDLTGRDNSDRSGFDTSTPVFGFDRYFCIRTKVRRVRRGVNGCGWACVVDSSFENLLEDFWQNGGVIRNVQVRDVGKLHITDQKVHPDILQFPGPIDVDGLVVTDYIGQCFAMGGTTASGSKLRNINISGARGQELMSRMVGNGAMIENADGKGGPSDILFENVFSDKPFFVRQNDKNRPERNWQGENIRGINSRFSNRSFVDEVISS